MKAYQPVNLSLRHGVPKLLDDLEQLLLLRIIGESVWILLHEILATFVQACMLILEWGVLVPSRWTVMEQEIYMLLKLITDQPHT